MTRFAVKMELYYTLNYSYHKIYTTQMNTLQLPMTIIHQTFEHNIQVKNTKLQALREGKVMPVRRNAKCGDLVQDILR